MKRKYIQPDLDFGGRTIIFLDKTDFNLHPSIYYGYSLVDTDVVLYTPRSKMKTFYVLNNINKWKKHNKILDSSFNKEIFFKTF